MIWIHIFSYLDIFSHIYKGREGEDRRDSFIMEIIGFLLINATETNLTLSNIKQILETKYIQTLWKILRVY